MSALHHAIHDSSQSFLSEQVAHAAITHTGRAMQISGVTYHIRIRCLKIQRKTHQRQESPEV